jgi:hypothetical protein
MILPELLMMVMVSMAILRVCRVRCRLDLSPGEGGRCVAALQPVKDMMGGRGLKMAVTGWRGMEVVFTSQSLSTVAPSPARQVTDLYPPKAGGEAGEMIG